ncbi:hypothetical protein CUR178_03510 [Leishmania enriettii]|uniref:Vasohibin n=1 Tax=Leishmania enriettii TaxID=5663 RepID=A0A836G5X9_LEIEN|nr:hypothetical protein CUR178_03510 [Leishmania enriettii]
MPDRLQSILEELSQQNPFCDQEDLPDPPRPSETAIPRDRPSAEQIPFIQQQISILSYNHLPRTFFSLEKHRSLQSILFTAKEALSEALPIRCLEATFVALHYTQALRDIDRIPLSFKSVANGKVYRHIVLVLRTHSSPTLYGTLGLSRKPTLMYKPLTYHSLFSVVMDYKREYEVLGHELLDIKLGIAITHDEHSRWDPCWRFIALKLDHYRDGANERSLARSPADHRSPISHGTLKTQARKSITRMSNASLSTSNGGHTALPPLCLGASRGENSMNCISEDAPSECSMKALGDSHSEAVAQLPPVGTFGSISSPTEPASSNAASLTHPLKTASGAAETYAPLAHMLRNYMRLLPIISEQYYKGIATVDNSNRALKLCFMDLDTAERDSSAENQRRLQLIEEMQSPLSAEAKRVAANRKLKSPKQKGAAKNAGSSSTGLGGSKRRQLSSGAAVSGRKANKRAPLTLPSSAGGADAKRDASSPRANFHDSPRMQPPSPVPDLARPSTSLDMLPSAKSERAESLSSALARTHPISRRQMLSQRIVVDTQNTGRFASPLGSGDNGTEGYSTPCDASHSTRSEDVFAALPLTPRNCDSRKPNSRYGSPPSSTSASDRLSIPSSLNASSMCSPRWLP